MDEKDLLDIMKYVQSYHDNSWGSKYDYDEEDIAEYKTPVKKYNYEKMLTGVMEYLEQVGGVEFAVMKDPELGRFWTAKVKVREEQRKRKEAVDKLHAALTKEELKILGINVK